MRVILYTACCFHLQRLFHHHNILHISVSRSHKTLILHLQKSPLVILKIWHMSQHQVVPQWLFFSRGKEGNGNSLMNNPMFVREYDVEEKNIKKTWTRIFFFSWIRALWALQEHWTSALPLIWYNLGSFASYFFL